MNEKSNFPLSIQASVLLGSVIIAVSILISGGVIKLQGFQGSQTQNPTAQASATPSPNQKVAGVTEGNLPTLGNNNAKVLVVEFADYQCPFCKKWFDEVEPSLKKDYIDTGKIKFAFRDWAFLGAESNDAANAARCANEQGKFWDYHDYLYTHQGQENSGAFSKDNLKKFAAALGLNADSFNSCVDSNKYAKDAQADNDAGKKYGVSGTPTVYINGTMLVGAQPYSAFKTAIDAALAGK